jgi:hypothetical protein
LIVSSPSAYTLVLGLSIAIGFFGVLLLISIVVYFMMRRAVHQRRLRLPDNQELSLQGPILEVVCADFTVIQHLINFQIGGQWIYSQWLHSRRG